MEEEPGETSLELPANSNSVFGEESPMRMSDCDDFRDSNSTCTVTEEYIVTNMLRRIFTKGILFAFGGVFFLTVGDICLSILTERMDSLFIIAVYSPLGSAMSFVSILVLRLPTPSGRQSYALLLLYGASMCLCINFIVGAVGLAPVADAISIVNCSPVFSAILGCIVLKQFLKVVDILLITVCIVGVVLIARPSFFFRNSTAVRADGEMVGIIFATLGAFSLALSFIWVRKLSDLGVDRLWMMLVGNIFIFIVNVGLCFLFEKWALPDPFYYLFIIVLYAACNFLAQICIYSALRRERVVNVAVILTFEIALLYILQVFFLKIASNWLTAVGALLITFSCFGMTLHQVDSRPTVSE